MKNEESIRAAEFICNTGKVVHDRLIKIQSNFFSDSKNGATNELSISQLHAIKVLLDSGELTMNQLSEKLAVSPPSASAMVDRLVEKGLICREHSAQDRRKVMVRISPEAVKIAEEIKANIVQLFIELIDKIGIETAQKWCAVLSSVKKALSNNPDI